MTTKAPMSVMFSKVEQSTPAVTTQVVFIPDNQVKFSYTETQNIHIPIRTAVENAFMDGRSSFLRFTIHNENDYDIMLDGLASSIFKRLTITAGGQTIQNIPEYNRLCELLQKHFSSDDYFNEMGILSGARLGHEDNYSLFTTADKKGFNTIPARKSKEYTCPLLSGFLMTKLLPLCFMSVANLNIELLLDDPRNSFIAEHLGTNAEFNALNNTFNTAVTAYVAGPTYALHQDVDDARIALLAEFSSFYDKKTDTFTLKNGSDVITTGSQSPKVSISNVEYIATIISLRDNDLVRSIANIMGTEGLYINACDYAVIQNSIQGGNQIAGTIDQVISDRSQSTKAFLNTFYRQQPSIYHSNLQSFVAGTTGYSMEIGGVTYPQGRSIEYNNTRHPSFIHPYLEFQKLVSGGYFNTNTHTNICMTTFQRQYCNNSDANPTVKGRSTALTVGNTGCVNTPYESSFVQTMCVENFHGMGGTESGLNTALLNVPIVFKFTRDIATFKDEDLTDKTLSSEASIRPAGVFPNFLMNTYVLHDVVYRLDSSGLWSTMK